MVEHSHYDVHTDTWITNGTAAQRPAPEAALPDARQLWREAVAAVAAKAKATLPESHGRIDAAVKIVLAGDVALLGDVTAKVASQSSGEVKYFVVNGACQCQDFERAPDHWCKHRLAYGLAKRAQERLETAMDHLDATPQASSQDAEDTHAVWQTSAPAAPAPASLPEAPASANAFVTIGGRQWQITLRDTDEDRLIARMERLMARYPVSEAAAASQQATRRLGAQHGVTARGTRSSSGGWGDAAAARAKKGRLDFLSICR